MNLYAYVGNDPINFKDPLGLDTNPTDGEERGCDNQGCGNYGAARGDRTHDGVDITADAGQDVKAPIGGTVRVVTSVYPNDDPDFDGVEITNDDGTSYKVFYVDPSVETGDVVEEGDVIGTAQDRAGDTDMTNHVHVEKRENGEAVDPTDDLLDE